MPARNLIKIDIQDGYYHIYNRGVEKRIIFQDEQDHKIFLEYLKEGLSPPPKTKDLLKTFTVQGTTFKGVPRKPKNYFGEINLLVYCLMPNHFHLMIKQTKKDSMESFMRSLATRYSMYFNKKYKRVGSLFQGIYKAALIDSDIYLLYLSRYIHLNPSKYTNKIDASYSSYADYIGKRNTPWIKKGDILTFFENAKSNKLFVNTNTYKNFVESESSNARMVPEGYLLDFEP